MPKRTGIPFSFAARRKREIKKLREDGYIPMGTDHLISLTEKGYTIARKIRNRHQVLMKLQPGVPEETAREDTCRMERDLSDESSDAIRGQIA